MRHILETRITRLFGIEHPILCSGMSHIAVPELVAAVSEAGGLGILATAPLTPDATRAAIRRIRELTSRPFGINITMLTAFAKGNVRVALEERVPLVNLSLGRSKEIADAVHGYGGVLVSTVTTEKHALAAQAAGADALIVTGYEAAGHGGAATSLTLVPAMRDAVELPIIAAGGFGDGRGLVAALALGADAIAMGTRFALSAESPLHAHAKEVALGKSVSDTLYSPNFDGIPCRMMDTPAARKRARRAISFIEALPAALLGAAQLGMSVRQIFQMAMAQPARLRQQVQIGALTKSTLRSIRNGDMEHGIMPIGQVQGIVGEVLPAAAIIARTLDQADAVLDQFLPA
jgi:enoyl-[acyl-carrier protein] reductase II